MTDDEIRNIRRGQGARPAPHSIEAERAVLGAMLLTRDARLAAANDHALSAADFYSPLHAALFAVMLELEAEGRIPDRLILRERMAAMGQTIDEAAIVALQQASPAVYNIGEHAAIVVRLATARRAGVVLEDALELAWAGDAGAALDVIAMAHDTLQPPLEDVPPPTDALDLAAEDHNVDWVIRGLLARHETVLFVAEPGSGKTTLLNQICVLCAAGFHPWHRTPIPPLTCLVFDFQDSRGSRGRQVQHMLGLLSKPLERGMLSYELRTQGIDLTQRADQRWFEAKVVKARPDLVVAGPLYNMVQGAAGRSKQSEETAQLAAVFLSQLAVRRNLALLVEAHAPHGEELRVRGSKLWEDWAGWGFGLRTSIVDGRREFKIERFRGDRETGRQWPGRFIQGHGETFPWEAMEVPRDPSGGTEEVF